MSERTILGVLRGCLCLWGLLWIAAGFMPVAFPEMMSTEPGNPVTSGERVVFAIFTIPYGFLLAMTPRFFARHRGIFAITMLLALALPATTLLLTRVTLRSAVSVAALCLFPLLMQTLLILHARSQPA